MRPQIYHLIAAIALSTTACGGQDPTPALRRADRISLASGGNQEAQVGAPLPAPVTFVVGDGQGPLPGVPVTFRVPDQAGFVSATSDTSDPAGVVSVTWILGGQLGSQTLTAAVAGAASATAQATARIGPLTLLIPVSEPSQFVVVGRTVASPPAIKATDAFGNPIAGQEITFVDATNRSQVQDATSITDVAGRAGVTSWRIAGEPGSYTLQARGPGFTTTNFVAFGIPAAVEVSAGDNQSANAGTLGSLVAEFRLGPGRREVPLLGVLRHHEVHIILGVSALRHGVVAQFGAFPVREQPGHQWSFVAHGGCPLLG